MIKRHNNIENLGLKYVKASYIVAEARNELGSLSNLKIDDTILYPYINRCLARLGEKILPIKTEVLPVFNYKAELPHDFYKMNLAVGCWEGTVKTPLERIHLEEKIVTELEMNACERKYSCELCTDDSGANMFKIVQKFDFREVEFSNYEIVKVNKQSSSNVCDSCVNRTSNSPYEITISGNSIITNFEHGTLYIEYTSLNQEGDYMIPDYPQITNWIKQELMYKMLLYGWNNGENDLGQRVQFAKKESGIAEHNALAFARRAEFQDYYNSIGTLVNKFNIHQSLVRTANGK